MNWLKIMSLVIILCILGTILSWGKGTGKIITQEYPIKDHGKLILRYPDFYIEIQENIVKQLPTTTVTLFVPEIPLKILFTPLWNKENNPVFSDESVKKIIQTQGQKLLEKTAIEKELHVNEIRKTNLVIYYYSLTDKSPEPGECKCITQGVIKMNELLISFTILSNNYDDRRVKDALDLLAGMEHQNGSDSDLNGQLIKPNEPVKGQRPRLRLQD